MLTKLLTLTLAVTATVALAACETESDSGGTDKGSSSPAGSSGSGGGSNCGTKATDDCTPTVGPNGKVRVDALIWRVKNVRTTKTLGDQEYGFGEKADGTFVVVTLRVRSDKDEEATLTDEAIKLEGRNGTTYSADTEGTVAAMGAGEDPLFLEDLGPDQSTTSKVVFDVPPKLLRKGAKLRFNELGFGETHGYISLPDGI